jgi:hypothetical protein
MAVPDISNPFFFPLSSQRYHRTVSILDEVHPPFLIDMGCADCGFLFYLSKNPAYLHFAIGLDKDVHVLKRGHRTLTGPSLIHRHPRPFAVALVREDVTQLSAAFVEQYKFCPFVSILELIEHLNEADLDAAVHQIFGALQPLAVFLTTPNAEYNEVLCRSFEGNRRFGTMRHPDHQFEWTRQEFATWCASVSAAFGYSANIAGVGQVVDGEDDGSVGFATHSVLFVKNHRVGREFASPENPDFLAVIQVDALENPLHGYTPQPTPEASEDDDDYYSSNYGSPYEPRPEAE